MEVSLSFWAAAKSSISSSTVALSGSRLSSRGSQALEPISERRLSSSCSARLGSTKGEPNQGGMQGKRRGNEGEKKGERGNQEKTKDPGFGDFLNGQP